VKLIAATERSHWENADRGIYPSGSEAASVFHNAGLPVSSLFLAQKGDG